MKKFLSLIVALVAFSFASSAQGVITFKEATHDFGKIKQNKPATWTFEFTNTGDAPIVVSNAQPSCGCTTPSWTKTPVLPGKTGVITAQFNAASGGAFNKNITVTSNATVGSVSLTIKGEVMPEAAPVAAPAPPVKATAASKK